MHSMPWWQKGLVFFALRPCRCFNFRKSTTTKQDSRTCLARKGFTKNKTSVGPLVSSQEQRARLVPHLNSGSNFHFVPPFVYIRFRLFVLLEGGSCDVSAIPWRVYGTCVSWANSFVGTQSCPTPPGRSAGRPDPTRPWYVRVLDSTNIFIFADTRCTLSGMHTLKTRNCKTQYV